MNPLLGMLNPGMMPDQTGGLPPAGPAVPPQTNRPPPPRNGVMSGLGRALGGQQGSQWAGMGWDQRLQALAAVVQDLGGSGGHLDAFQEHRRGDSDRQRQEASRRARAEAVRAALKPDGTFDSAAYLQAVSGLDDASVEDFATARELGRPDVQIIPGRNGAWSAVDRTTLQERASHPGEADPFDVPNGYRMKADGSGIELIPGYVEGQGTLTGTRREAVIAHPMPSRARSGGRRPAPRSKPAAPAPWSY